MRHIAKLGYLAAACALLVATFSIIGPRAVQAVAALLVQDVNTPGLQPFHASCTTSTFDSSGRASCTFATPVPSGKRLVIETISGDLDLATGTSPVEILLQGVSGGTGWETLFPATFQGSSAFFFGDHYAVNQLVRLYADAGTAPFFNLTISNTTAGFVDLEASGYLINTP